MPEFVGRLRTPRLATAPATPSTGELWYDTASNLLKFWNGSAWLAGPPIDDTTLPSRLRSQVGSIPITDCNAGTLSGWYGIAGALTNAPSGASAGYLEVYSWDVAGNVIVQFYHEYAGYKSWKRYMWGGWSAWVQIYPVDDNGLPARIKSFEDESVADADSYQQSGWFHLTAGAANSPPGATDWHVLVLRHTSAYVKQIAYNYYSDAIWQRAKTNPASAFSAWTQVFPVPDAGLPLRLGSWGSQVVSDWNSATVDGWYYSTSALNQPQAGYPFVGHVSAYSGGIIQTLWMKDYPNQFVRIHNGSTWSKWQKTAECLVAGTIRKSIGGFQSGTFDGAGNYVVPFGRTVTNVVSVTVTNANSGQLSVTYSVTAYSATGFTLTGWNINNTPTLSQPFSVGWIAMVDE